MHKQSHQIYPDGAMKSCSLNLASKRVAIWQNVVGNAHTVRNGLFTSDRSVK